MRRRQLHRLTIGLLGLALALGLALGPASQPQSASGGAPVLVAGDDPGSHGGGG